MFGSAFHCAALEPARFASEYVVAPKCDKRTKAGKEEYTAFEAQNGGKEFLDPDDMTAILAMSENIKAHPIASGLLREGISEVSMFWDHPEYGCPCKARIDWLPAVNAIVDLKTTKDACPAEFARDVAKYQYDAGAAWYIDGYLAITGKPFIHYMWLAVENTPPYAVAVYLATPEIIQNGRRKCSAMAAVYTKCRNSGSWPGYRESVDDTLILPRWALVD